MNLQDAGCNNIGTFICSVVSLLVTHVSDFHGLQMLVTCLATSSTKPYPARFEVITAVLIKFKSSGTLCPLVGSRVLDFFNDGNAVERQYLPDDTALHHSLF